MNLDEFLSAQLKVRRAENQYRQLRVIESAQGAKIAIGGEPLLNFSSNDYLGLATQADMARVASRATQRAGTGSGSSRLICGNMDLHSELDTALARFKGSEAALSFTSGYLAAMGAITAVVGKGDVIILDKLSHACLVDAARQCGATLRVFPHNNLGYLRKLLASARDSSPEARVLVVTESVFSMDGDTAPLREICDLKDEFGAWLMVDEAHATGIYGEARSGLINEYGLGGRIEIQLATLGKALGSSGGAICGSSLLIDYLINTARAFIYDTGMAPGVAAAGIEALRFVESEKGAERCRRLWDNVVHFLDKLPDPWRQSLADRSMQSPILPLIFGENHIALEAARRLHQNHILVPAIRYPTVGRNEARLRVTISASHLPEQIDFLCEKLTAVADLMPSKA